MTDFLKKNSLLTQSLPGFINSCMLHKEKNIMLTGSAQSRANLNISFINSEVIVANGMRKRLVMGLHRK